MDDPTVQMVYVDNELEPAPTPLVPYKQLVGRPQSRHAFAPDRNSVNATLTVEQVGQPCGALRAVGWGWDGLGGVGEGYPVRVGS